VDETAPTTGRSRGRATVEERRRETLPEPRTRHRRPPETAVHVRSKEAEREGIRDAGIIIIHPETLEGDGSWVEE
jgi:hypothetical protein